MIATTILVLVIAANLAAMILRDTRICDTVCYDARTVNKL